jgi:CRISPR system Cascade subunit CasD
MQSWGYASRFTRRTTALFPTKSAMVGLLSAALGIDKYCQDESAKIAPLAALRCVSVHLPRRIRDTELPIRLLVDYHTIGGGYDKKADSMKKPRSAEGTVLGTILSERHYLLDARFGILLEGNRSFLEQIAASLRNPKWGLWLGRKCCLPASPLLAACCDDSAAGLRALLQRAGYEEHRALESFDHVIEGPEAEALDGEWLQDTPIAFGAPLGERHRARRIRHVRRR